MLYGGTTGSGFIRGEGAVNFDAESIAMRYANRPGCRFLGFKAIGICVFALRLRAIVLEAREIPPIEEFVLRFLGVGIETPRDLSRLMGLELRLIERRLVELRRNELIDVFGDAQTPRDAIQCQLTDKGREAAHMLQRTVMQEVTLPNVIFHGLLRRPVQFGDISKRTYLRPKEAKERGLELIRAIPNRAPRIDEIDIAELDKIVKTSVRPRPGEPLQDVVAVKTVLRPVQTRYEPGVLLEYETTDRSRTRQVAFAIEGQLLEEYETAFAKAKGPELLREILCSKHETFEERARREIPAEIRARLGRLDDIEELAARAASAQQELIDAQENLNDPDRADTRQLQQQEIERLKQHITSIEAERNQRKVKYLWTQEIREKLWEALETCEERLLILSGFINSEVVDEEFELALRKALERGVQIWIGYGFDKGSRRGDDQRQQQSWVQAERRLERLKADFPDQIDYRDVRRSHEKRVICDNRFALGGSFNFLSFSGEQRGKGKVRHEGADLIEDPDYCEELYKRYLRLFFR